MTGGVGHPFRVHWRFTLAALVVVTVTIVSWLAVRGRSPFGRTDDSPGLEELVEAMSHQQTRAVEGRLSTRFAYAPMAAATRGDPAREVTPEIRIAAAHIEKRGREDASAANLAALGVAHLVLGDGDKAVDVLERAADASPRDPLVHNDLSVAYLARARGQDRPEDWAPALAAAQRAIRLDPRRPEPYFNRALAFHGLHLAFEENEAWSGAMAIERSGPWAAEAAAHQRQIAERTSVANETSPSPSDNQRAREHIEGTLLPQWAAAVEDGELDTAARLIAEAAPLAEQLAASGGDAMARDEIARIRRFTAGRQHHLVRELAIGHRLHSLARVRFLEDKALESSELMSQAAGHLRRTGSPYQYAAPIALALALRSKGNAQAALNELRTLPLDALPAHYLYLRSRAAWIEGLLRGSLGRYDLARGLLTRAARAFESGAELENLIAVQTVLAEVEWFLGHRETAWTELVSALSNIERLGKTRRTVHFEVAAMMSLGAGLPEAALEFHHALVRVAATDTARAEAYLRRARTRVRLRDLDAADADLRRAEEVAIRSEAAARERITNDIALVRAELFSGVDCQRTFEYSDSALPYLQRSAGTIRRSTLLSLRARCRRSTGDLAGARADLLEAVGAFEARRSSIGSPADRAQAFELERAAFRDLIDLESQSGDDDAALRMAERARAGVLAEAWGADEDDGLDHRRLPPDVAVIYFETLPSRVLVWVLTRERQTAFARPIEEPALRRSVAEIRRVVQQGANISALRPHTATLFETLVAPALEMADGAAGQAHAFKPMIVFIPDGALFGVPFAALPDTRGRALIESRTVSVALSLKTLLAASARLTSFVPSDILSVGDGHDPANTGLPILPRANSEAAAVASLYPRRTVLIGENATRRRFLSTGARIIHFAGHTVLNERYPMLSRMLLAPDPRDGDSGWLLASDITPQHFGRTDLVMLATCEGAAGAFVEGEGALSIARAFFAAGVPAVVASLWPVDDDLQTLVGTFHRTLAAERDPARALRAAQRALLAERGVDTPVRVWGGFIMLGAVAGLS